MRQTLHLFYGLVVFLLGTVGIADDVIIDRVEAMSHGSKSSIIIRYSGTERIQFFAIDGADDELTLDFPGVISNVDFSQISTEQLDRIEGLALDPNSDRGIGMHLFTRPNVSYEVFEGEPGALIVYLEDASSEPDRQLAKPAPTPVNATKSAEITQEPSLAASVASYHISGQPGEARLFSVDVDLLDRGGRITLDVAGEPAVSTFSLPDPLRFVVDLKGTVFGLDENDLKVDSAYLQRIRIRQFRVEPDPITRLVLDLKKDVEVQTVAEGRQVLVHFAPTSAELAALKATDFEPKSEIQEFVPSVLEVDDSPVIADSSVEPTPIAPDLVILPDSKASAQDEGVESPLASAEPEQGTAEAAENPDDTLEAWLDPASSPDVHTVAVEPVVEETIQPDPEVQVAEASSTEAAAPAVETAKAPFELAEDVDLAIQQFAEDDGSFYSRMKDTPRNHHRSDPILVTNQTIASTLELAESRNLQMEEDVGQASLFEKVEEFVDGYETIGGGDTKYRGFEIQKIDVKDANVVDLLRFLADQVGFNLYVDPSVTDLKATYSFRNIPWDQAMDIILRNAGLDWEFENGVLRVATTEKFKKEAQARQALRIERELSVPVETVTFPLSYAKVAEVVPIVEQYLSPRGTILQDARTNTLIIEDIPKRMVAIRTLIRRLDTRVPQVSIESRIVETTKRFLRELGIQWGLSAEYSPEMGTQTGVTFPQRVGVGGPRIGVRDPLTDLQGGYAVNFPVIDENPSGIGLSLGNFLDTFQLDISLQTLESDGLGQIISAPKVTTQNNMTAFIKNGQRIPIQTVQRGTITVRYIDAVLELEVTPHITSEKTIIMDLVVDKSEPDFTRTVLGNPIINVRRAETRVLVKDGGTTVIGGIFVLNEQEASAGIPGVRKLPIIKYLFGSQLNSLQNQELLIFITPRIIKY